MGLASMVEVPDRFLDWAAQLQRYRASGELAAAEALRDRIEAAGYVVADTPQGAVVVPASRYATVDPDDVPDRSGQPDGLEASVLLLLDAHGAAEPEPAWLAGDAARCLASVLRHCQGHPYEVAILDNGVGGAVGDWAADAARGPGIEAIHLAEPVGFAQARALQQRAATGRVLLWLDTGVELTADPLTSLLAAFDDPTVGAAGHWGANVRADLSGFEAADPPAAGEGPREAHVVWGYLLGLRRQLVAARSVQLDPAYRSFSNADADVSLQVRAAGARTVLVDLPVVQRVHRGVTEVPAAVLEQQWRDSYRYLLGRWRGLLENLAAG